MDILCDRGYFGESIPILMEELSLYLELKTILVTIFHSAHLKQDITVGNISFLQLCSFLTDIQSFLNHHTSHAIDFVDPPGLNQNVADQWPPKTLYLCYKGVEQ